MKKIRLIVLLMMVCSMVYGGDMVTQDNGRSADDIHMTAIEY